MILTTAVVARTLRSAMLIGAFFACGSSADDKAKKQSQCEQIATDIRTAAKARGIPSDGACNNQSAPELAGACAALSACNDELAKL